MVLFINKNNAFKRNTSHLCFFMFFRANDFQEKLGNNSFIFKFNLTSHQLSDDQFPSVLFTKFEKKPKSKYTKHRKQLLRGFLQNKFYDTLTLENKCSKMPVNQLIF